MNRFLLCAFLLSAPVWAELPPSAYDSFRKDAPDAVVMKLDKVTTTPLTGEGLAPESCHVVVDGTVTGVRRSAHKLKKGDRVRFAYDHTVHTMGWAGPRVMPVLAKGAVTPVYLRKTAAGGWEPAAQGGSFQDD